MKGSRVQARERHQSGKETNERGGTHGTAAGKMMKEMIVIDD
jgi:hypothetical protein